MANKAFAFFSGWAEVKSGWALLANCVIGACDAVLKSGITTDAWAAEVAGIACLVCATQAHALIENCPICICYG